MTRSEFLLNLENELIKNGISDFKDIVEEYDMHFSYKLADGYSEESVAESLGTPENVAKQYGDIKIPAGKWKKILSCISAFFLDLFYGIFCIFMGAWEIVGATVSVSFAAVAVWLFCGQNISAFDFSLEMPYAAELIFGISFIALTALAVSETVYFFGFIRQFSVSYFRFRGNIKAKILGNAVLPAIPVYPRFSVRKRTALRSVSVASAVIFAVSLIVGYVVCAVSSGSFAFWHAWNWFVA